MRAVNNTAVAASNLIVFIVGYNCCYLITSDVRVIGVGNSGQADVFA